MYGMLDHVAHLSEIFCQAGHCAGFCWAGDPSCIPLGSPQQSKEARAYGQVERFSSSVHWGGLHCSDSKYSVTFCDSKKASSALPSTKYMGEWLACIYSVLAFVCHPKSLLLLQNSDKFGRVRVICARGVLVHHIWNAKVRYVLAGPQHWGCYVWNSRHHQVPWEDICYLSVAVEQGKAHG